MRFAVVTRSCRLAASAPFRILAFCRPIVYRIEVLVAPFPSEYLDDLNLDDDVQGADGATWREVATWEAEALALANDVVSKVGGGDLKIFTFRALARPQLIKFSLDKLSNKYGSPDLDEITTVARRYREALDEMGTKTNIPDSVEVQVSSPGAERRVIVPDELRRFASLPLRVVYEPQAGTAAAGGDAEGELQDQILNLVEYDEIAQVARWRLANVRANRAQKTKKGQGLNKKQRESVIEVKVSDIKGVFIHVDF
eukprot:jgi/Mesvir1/23564/Mv18260-RA.1